ncbi:MAG: hypothetical protein HQ477_05485 [Chloroflexi bacterium]|jgi:hypothetical protein|nr:hypothetical protein [Chloroflexota bacterium]
MPVIGPAVDHHYADRSPEHTHLLVGEKTNLHEHLLTGHRHISVDVNGDGISVTSTSVSPAYGSLTLDGATLELLIPGYSPHMVAIQVGAPVIPDDEAIAPLDRPPRRA